MAKTENKLPLQTLKTQTTSDTHTPSLNLSLDKLDLKNLEMLRPTLDKMNAIQAQHFNPVRFRFIESMAAKALQHRSSVAKIIEQKALQALSEYVKEYLCWQNQTSCPDSQKDRVQGELSKLTQEIFHSSHAKTIVSQATLEEELSQQEKDIIHSMTPIMTHSSNNLPICKKPKTNYNELSVMQHFRQSKAKNHSEQRLTRVMQEGPEDAGPLNSQALIIRSLNTMHELSPGYINRFISYMDTLLWLEQAGEEGKTTKIKNKGRRKS